MGRKRLKMKAALTEDRGDASGSAFKLAALVPSATIVITQTAHLGWHHQEFTRAFTWSGTA